ncbi:MAG: sugar hydrolase [Bacteroidetes bacterium HGW-Bacteroidetes-1]|jgi:predicted alpha-1,2-mannosidase|nr:MAG: sugar hydrolase [Bacteroidetes bacterium HGW-Bacteroidetes-1]
MRYRYIFIILLFFSGTIALSQEPIDWVNPLIGTAEMGHTYPGATMPFGMVQLSPDTDTIPYSTRQGYNQEVYRYCSGYQYYDSTICGFSHTHFSGTGHSDLGDFLLMATTGKLKLNPGTASLPESGYRSRFSHETEIAEPGYYRVFLDDYGIKAELTATERAGIHRYTPDKETQMNLILDMAAGIYNYPGKNIWQFVRVENDTLVTGYRQTRGWARTRLIYFAMSLSKPISDYGSDNQEEIIYKGFYRKFNEKESFPEMAGKNLKVWFRFDISPSEPLTVKLAVSSVSSDGALNNLKSETYAKTFDQIKAEAQTAWNQELGRISIKADSVVMVNAYTALYHSFLGPTLYEDVDGKYRGIDQNIHQTDHFHNYSTFSLWDTYRALHPFLSLIQQQRTSDMINAMLAHRKQSVHGILPIWSHHANENWCMIGYHAVPVIADAIMKDIGGFEVGEALEAMQVSAEYDTYDGIGDYRKLGYVPSDMHVNAASKTLEYAFDDWCLAMAAKKTGNQLLSETYFKRAGSYKNIYDRQTDFMRPRLSNETFQEAFDPLKTEGQGFIEGNAWNYSLYVPHNVYFMIESTGGVLPFVSKLDQLFEMPLDEEHIAESEDISHHGIIGNYVHGNEPSHHIPYLYSYAGMPHKNQQRVREILHTLYKPFPDGLPGNDDCGQMSAWYLFSALGFYPVCPASNEYVFGSPLVDEAVLKLENGNSFIIKAKNNDKDHKYIKSIFLNGERYDKLFITHQEIMKGGELLFEMSDKPTIIKYKESSLPGKSY